MLRPRVCVEAVCAADRYWVCRLQPQPDEGQGTFSFVSSAVCEVFHSLGSDRGVLTSPHQIVRFTNRVKRV